MYGFWISVLIYSVLPPSYVNYCINWVGRGACLAWHGFSDKMSADALLKDSLENSVSL